MKHEFDRAGGGLVTGKSDRFIFTNSTIENGFEDVDVICILSDYRLHGLFLNRFGHRCRHGCTWNGNHFRRFRSH